MFAQCLYVIADFVPVQRHDVDFYNVRELHQGLERFVVNKVIQCDGVTLVREAFNPCNDFVISFNIFQQFQYHAVFGQGNRVFVNEKRTRQVNKGQAVADNVVQADFQKGVDDDV